MSILGNDAAAGRRAGSLATRMNSTRIWRFAHLADLPLCVVLAGCDTVSRSVGPSAQIAVLEEESKETTSANIGSLSEVIQRNPADPSAYNTRGAAYAKVGRYSDAIADFDRAVQIDPN